MNSDLFFQSIEPSIRSFSSSVRNFGQWGNVPVSVEEYRIIQYNDRNLLRFGSGIYFDNRLLQTAIPFTCPAGVAHRAILPLNFDVVSTFKSQLPPSWEGQWEGLAILELMTEDFGGRQRAFATVWSEAEQAIEFWELSSSIVFDHYDNRIEWYIEFPAFNFGKELDLKKLIGGELWFDLLRSEAVFTLDYRPDGHVCWFPWHTWTVCTDTNLDPLVQAIESVTPYTRVSYRQTQSFPKPKADCAQPSSRPTTIGYQFQARLKIKGAARVRGFFLHAEPVERKLYDKQAC